MRIGAIAAMAVLAAACGSSSAVSTHSPEPTSTASATGATPTAQPAGVMVLLVKDSQSPDKDTLELIDTTGHVDARADFVPPARAFVANCAPVPPPPVRVAGGRAYFADSTGTIHRLDPTGALSTVATFPITSTSFLSYAVSPDGQKLIAIVFNTPTPKNPMPPLGTDPFVATSHWTLDVETALAGGSTTKTLHRDFGHDFSPQPGPTLIAGWDDGGPVATLGSIICVQDMIPSVGYTGSALIHIGQDGTHLDTIGGPGCAPLDELHDGTVLCDDGPYFFSVRTRGGSVSWRGATLGGILLEPRLSPDGTAVSVNNPGDRNEIFSRDNSVPASSARNSTPAETLLGWVGNDYVLATRSAAPYDYGLLPRNDLSNFIVIGHFGTVCDPCFPNVVTLAGTIGI